MFADILAEITRDPARFMVVPRPHERMLNLGPRVAMYAITHAANDRIQDGELKRQLMTISHDLQLEDTSLNFCDIKIAEDHQTGSLIIYAETPSGSIYRQPPIIHPIMFMHTRNECQIGIARLKLGAVWAPDPANFHVVNLPFDYTTSIEEGVASFLEIIYADQTALEVLAATNGTQETARLASENLHQISN